MPSKLRLPDGTFVQAADLSTGEAEAALATAQVNSITIPTAAGATDTYLSAPFAGSLSAVQVTPLTALAAHDTNYVAWTITNLGQDNTGTNAMLATSPTGVNTTKVTGGTALAVNTAHALTVHGTAANLVVAKGDRLKITATGNGTLANTVTVPTYLLTFTRTS